MRTTYLCLTSGEASRLRNALPEREDLERTAHLLAALADPTRLRVAVVLAAASELCVGDTAALLDLPVKLVSHHARALAARGLATKHRDGKLIRYRLTDDARHLLETALARPLPISVIVAHRQVAESAR